ncbi:hypothetical protein LBMAG42_08300 [Deltaproteobacteria bacterium]|nr:hypothetical protein LBMAG42_08300 [Deltaproteobacteria bacterium]
MEWFAMGGFPMIVIVVFGLVGIVNAARFAWAPGPGRVGYLAALGVAVALAGVGGMAVDLIAVSVHVPEHPEWVAENGLGMIVLQGVGESLTPIVLASGLLIAQSLLVALGLRRLGG